MKTRFSHAAAFGLAAGMASIALALLLYLLTGPMSGWNYLSYIIALVIFGLGAKKWAAQESGGYITFGKAYMHMLIQTIIYSVIMAIWTYVFFVYIAPHSIENMLLMMEVQWEEQGMDQAQIDTMLEMTSKWMTPASMTTWALVMNVAFFAIVNLISAAIVKKDPPPAQFMPPSEVPYQNIPPQQ